jgi:hypothetical protein
MFFFRLIEHFYRAHIQSNECSWRLVNVLACSQVSHPEMRLVNAAFGASFHFPFVLLWSTFLFQTKILRVEWSQYRLASASTFWSVVWMT